MGVILHRCSELSSGPLQEHTCQCESWLSTWRMWSHLDQLKGMTVMVSVEKFHRGRRSLLSVDFSIPCTAVWCAYTIQPYTVKEKDGGSEWSPSIESHFLTGSNVTGCLTRLLPRIQQLSPTFFPGHTSPLPQQTHHLTVSQKKKKFPFFLKFSFFLEFCQQPEKKQRQQKNWT